ncbi:MAG: hypothetical protein JO127_08455 [Caulobacteraceae bacterium]|nr:hypothetical protein [Caulobacteraceae bacterium]
MNVRTTVGVGLLGLGLCGCYHLERPALRMERPGGPAALSAYAAAKQDYPSAGGDILKGTAPAESATYQATIEPAGAARPPARPPVAAPPPAPRGRRP